MWDEIVKRSATTYGLTEKEKRQIAPSVYIIKSFLGDGFLNEAEKVNHPLYRSLTNRDQSTYRWLIWFAQELSELKKHKNYQILLDLLTKLNDKKEFFTALPVLEASTLLSKKGYQIVHIEPDPKLEENRSDFSAQDPTIGTELPVEVTRSFEPRKVSKAREAYEEVVRTLSPLQKEFNYGGRVFRPLYSDEIKLLKQKLINIKSGGTREVEISKVIKLTFAKKSKEEILPSWADNGIETNFYNDRVILNKILKNLKGKLKQHPQIIILESNEFPTYIEPEKQIDIARRIERWIMQHSDILGLIIVNLDGCIPLNGMYKKTTQSISQNFTFARRLLPSREGRRYLIFSNPRCEIDKAEVLLKNLLNAYLEA